MSSLQKIEDFAFIAPKKNEEIIVPDIFWNTYEDDKDDDDDDI